MQHERRPVQRTRKDAARGVFKTQGPDKARAVFVLKGRASWSEGACLYASDAFICSAMIHYPLVSSSLSTLLSIATEALCQTKHFVNLDNSTEDLHSDAFRPALLAWVQSRFCYDSQQSALHSRYCAAPKGEPYCSDTARRHGITFPPAHQHIIFVLYRLRLSVALKITQERRHTDWEP